MGLAKPQLVLIRSGIKY